MEPTDGKKLDSNTKAIILDRLENCGESAAQCVRFCVEDCLEVQGSDLELLKSELDNLIAWAKWARAVVR